MPRCALRKTILIAWLFLNLLVPTLHAQNSAPPTIDLMSPASASPASNVVQVIINGANLFGATASSFTFSPSSGISVSNVLVALNGNGVAADFNVCGALPGTYNLTITTGGGTSNSLAFTVIPSGPVINDTAPRAGAPGTSFPIAILGCALQNTSSILPQAIGVSFNNVSSTGTQVTANMTIAPSTPQGQFFLSVANSVGTSNSILFNVVVGPAPSLSSLSPPSQSAGSTFSLTLTGSNLANASEVTFTPSSGISATITGNSDSQITALVNIDASVAPGNYVVTATTPAGTSNGLIFTVGAGSGPTAPVITSLSPASVAAGSGSFKLTVNGSGFAPGATVLFNGSTRTTSFVNSGQLTAKILAADVASAGNKSINVANPANGNNGGPVSNAATLVVH